MQLDSAIQQLRKQLVNHRLYQLINDADTLRHFMRAHVFCVWDFQSLLKALQRELTCINMPWLPTPDVEARRLINEIVLEEESDELPDGGYASHFELYLDAMGECGAHKQPIESLIGCLYNGEEIDKALEKTQLPGGVKPFLNNTFAVIRRRRIHELVALFAYTREDILPDIFQQLVQQRRQRQPQQWYKFLYYLNRHIEVDGERHGPISHALLGRICRNDERKWREASVAAVTALEARLTLWDCLAQELEKKSELSKTGS